MSLPVPALHLARSTPVITRRRLLLTAKLISTKSTSLFRPSLVTPASPGGYIVRSLPSKKFASATDYRLCLFADIAFSYYRKTFGVIFAANLIAFIVFVVRNRGAPAAPSVGSAASANLMVTLLFRQENFVNLVYELATDVIPLSAPLWMRRRLAKVFHYGEEFV